MIFSILSTSALLLAFGWALSELQTEIYFFDPKAAENCIKLQFIDLKVQSSTVFIRSGMEGNQENSANGENKVVKSNCYW